jgi:hypothetical protein
MKKTIIALSFCCGILPGMNVVAEDCQVSLLQLRTSDASGVHIYDVSKMTLDFCVGAINCQGWSGTARMTVNPDFPGCTQADVGYVVCDFGIRPESLKIAYYQNGNQTRIKIQDDHNTITFASGTARQRREIQDKDFRVTATTSDICPPNVATR